MADVRSGGLVDVALFAQLLPVPGQQFVEAGLRHVGDAGEHVCEPCERIDSVEFARGDEAEHERGAVTAAIRTNEEPGFSSPGNGSERAFGGVVRQTDAAIVEERDKGGPCVVSTAVGFQASVAV